MLRWIKLLIARIFLSIKPINILDKESIQLGIETQQVKEDWFSRQNVLVAEFAEELMPVYGSNFEGAEPMYWLNGWGKRVDKEGKLLLVQGEEDEDDKFPIHEKDKEYLLSIIYGRTINYNQK